MIKKEALQTSLQGFLATQEGMKLRPNRSNVLKNNHYVFSFQYMKNMEQATHRHDLQGKPVEELTDEHKQFAREWIQDREKEKSEKEKI